MGTKMVERERETLTPGARAPRRTAWAEETSPALDSDSDSEWR